MQDEPATARYWDLPVLTSVIPVVENSKHVRTSQDAVTAVAGWMAFEDFAFPSGMLADDMRMVTHPDDIMDVTFLETTLNFAFTDFDTGIKYEVAQDGRLHSDTDGMAVRIQEAIGKGIPLLNGEFLASITRTDLESIFLANIEMPMLDERVAILNAVGATLVDRYDGCFHRFIRDCAPAMYADGDGILERLVVEFPRFDDISNYHGSTVKMYKLAQLGLWMLHRALHTYGDWQLTDLADMTAFADYIVPVGLHLMGILEYTADLDNRIGRGVEIGRDSDEEIEIRAHTLYATALLTDEMNAIRPEGKQLMIPQTDYRFWKTYHATFQPHHLTKTVMY